MRRGAGAPKGHPKYGGRKKGTPNKSVLPLAQKAEELGVDPFVILLLFAKSDWKALGYESKTETRGSRSGATYEVERITADQRLRAAAEACQYLHSKRKAIQLLDESYDPSKDPCEEYSDEEIDEM